MEYKIKTSRFLEFWQNLTRWLKKNRFCFDLKARLRVANYCSVFPSVGNSWNLVQHKTQPCCDHAYFLIYPDRSEAPVVEKWNGSSNPKTHGNEAGLFMSRKYVVLPGKDAKYKPLGFLCTKRCMYGRRCNYAHPGDALHWNLAEFEVSRILFRLAWLDDEVPWISMDSFGIRWRKATMIRIIIPTQSF